MALSTGLFASPPVTSIRRRLVPLRFSGAAGLSDCAASAIAHTAGPSASRKASNARREILMSMVFSPTLSPLYSSAINLASDHPIKMIVPSSGESHQRDELSPVKKVEPERGTSPQPQRGSLLCEGFKEEHFMGVATDAIHVGQEPEPATGAIVAPIFQTSTYVQEELGKDKGYDYARTAHPNRRALERCVARLEGGQAAYVFTSGMAAIDAMFRLLVPAAP